MPKIVDGNKKHKLNVSTGLSSREIPSFVFGLKVFILVLQDFLYVPVGSFSKSRNQACHKHHKMS
jgi:hypothetical protein